MSCSCCSPWLSLPLYMMHRHSYAPPPLILLLSLQHTAIEVSSRRQPNRFHPPYVSRSDTGTIRLVALTPRGQHPSQEREREIHERELGGGGRRHVQNTHHTQTNRALRSTLRTRMHCCKSCAQLPAIVRPTSRWTRLTGCSFPRPPAASFARSIDTTICWKKRHARSRTHTHNITRTCTPTLMCLPPAFTASECRSVRAALLGTGQGVNREAAQRAHHAA